MPGFRECGAAHFDAAKFRVARQFWSGARSAGLSGGLEAPQRVRTRPRERGGMHGMKVLQVLCGGSWGGGGVVVLAYVSEMIRRGDEVWVVCLDDEVERRFAEAGARTVRMPWWFHAINPFDVIPFVQLWRLCRRERFDLVATHTSKGGFIGRLAAKAAGAPCVVHHAHGFAFRETQKPWLQRCYASLER